MSQNNNSLHKAILWFIPSLFSVYLIYFVASNAVNIPYWDGWSLLDVIAGVRAFDWDFIWEQNVDHRMVWNNLFLYAWAKTTNWNVYDATFFFGIFIIIGAFLFLSHIESNPAKSKSDQILLVFSLSALFLNLGQWKNLLWSFQFDRGLLFLSYIIFAIYFRKFITKNNATDLIVLVFIVFFAAFSSAHGLALGFFLIGYFILSQIHREKVKKSFYFLAGLSVVNTVIYFYGYRPSQPITFFHKPFEAFQFMLAFLGSPFRNMYISEVYSFILIIAIIFSIAYNFKDFQPNFMLTIYKNNPLIMLSIILGLMIMAGRFRFGIDAATDSRFRTFAIFFSVGSWLFLFRMWERKSRIFKNILLGLFFFCSTSIYITGFTGAYGYVKTDIALRNRFVKCILSNPNDFSKCNERSPRGSSIYPDRQVLLNKLKLLEKHNLSFFSEKQMGSSRE